MKRIFRRREQAGGEHRLNYQQAVELVSEFFAWTPSGFSAMVIKAVSRLTHPLEQGTYSGPMLEGEPHRAAWVIASPLTVFALTETNWWRRVILAARLRTTGPVNIIRDDSCPPVHVPEEPEAEAPSEEGALSGEAGVEKMPRSSRRRGSKRKNVEPVPGEAKDDNPMILRLDEYLEALGMEGSGAPHIRGLNEDLEALVALQERSEVSFTVVPVVTAHNQLISLAPSSSIHTRVYRYSPIRMLKQFADWTRTTRTTRVRNCTPIVLSKWIEEYSVVEEPVEAKEAPTRFSAPSDILKHVLDTRRKAEHRLLVGPPLVPRWDVKKRVLNDPGLRRYMEEYGREEGLTQAKVTAEAKGYIEEIAADYRTGVARHFCKAADVAFKQLQAIPDVDREGFKYLSDCDPESRIVFVCNHKSYLDPVVLGYCFYRSGRVPPHQAAGLNLNIWPLGWLLRHSAGFFLRRSFAGEKLYREVFSAYVRFLLEQNFSTAVFIEGTRSRDGKLQRPKTGFLSILEEALEADACPDITLIPVYIGYDKVPEEQAHVREMAGEIKTAETIKGLARLYNAVSSRLGRLYLKFGTPMSFRGLREGHSIEELADIMCEGINDATIVTSRCLAAAALLAPGTVDVTIRQFTEGVDALLGYAEKRRLPLAIDAEPAGVRAALDWYASEQYVTVEGEGDDLVIRVEGDGRRFMEYNKNVIIAHFLHPAVAAVAGDSHGGEFEENVRFVRDLFSEEFLFNEEIDSRWNIDFGGYLEILKSMLASYFEAYLVANRVFSILGTEDPVNVDDVVSRAFEVASVMLEEEMIRREEAVSRIAFRNAIKSYERLGLVRRTFELDENDKTITRVQRVADRREFELIQNRILALLGSSSDLTEDSSSGIAT